MTVTVAAMHPPVSNTDPAYHHYSNQYSHPHQYPITPPWTNTFAPSLPSISSFDFDNRSSQRAEQKPQILTPPHLVTPSEDAMDFAATEANPMVVDHHATYAVDWIDWTRTRSAHFIAEKTCEMICYVWFSRRPSPSPPPPPTSTQNTSPLFKMQPTTTLQLMAAPAFVQFMQKLLETTQVSQSVIVLALHYIYRFKNSCSNSPGQPGSEHRIAIVGLIMANKFLDDNTYTNKTWSEVSNISLSEINAMEKEFLKGLDYKLYVDKPTYATWTNLLKGLVMAKERDSRKFLNAGSRRASRPTLRTHDMSPSRHRAGPATAIDGSHHSHRPYHRARSTSPHRARMPSLYIPNHNATPAAAAPAPSRAPEVPTGGKRTADAAFSPPSAALHGGPAKRPLPGLVIPSSSSGRSSVGLAGHSPLEGLGSFADLALNSPAGPSDMLSGSTWVPSRQPSPQQQPSHLVAEYKSSDDSQRVLPQNLYFYSLSCSPPNATEYPRKGKLKYHQPHTASSYDLYGPPQPLSSMPPPPAPLQPPPTSSYAAYPTSTRSMFNLATIPKYASTTTSSPSRRVSPSDMRISPLRSNAASAYHPYVSSSSARPYAQSASSSPVHYQRTQHHLHPIPMNLNFGQQSQYTLPPLPAPPPLFSSNTAPTRLYNNVGSDADGQAETFANAGPPGVSNFYPTPDMDSRGRW